MFLFLTLLFHKSVKINPGLKTSLYPLILLAVGGGQLYSLYWRKFLNTLQYLKILIIFTILYYLNILKP